MKWQGLNELRESFLTFFETKEHLRLPSASLIPQGDKSLLLINSGMAPLKKYFLGQVTPPSKRVTTCQKCIRTPDIERVGQTARHGTYFEMLGNFSFGDYFKEDAIAWGWEFFTKELEIPVEKIYVSVFEEDDEAYDIWTKQIGVAPEHMVRCGRDSNFWEHGAGPCGPCSEMYFDRGPEKGCGRPDCKPGCDCDRYVEVWNLVFSQFDSDGKGTYTEMEHKNIDTGMGLERLACVMQGVDNLFEVDTVQSIMQHVCRIAGVTYGADDKTDMALRVITDHIRSTTFMIGDGVMPSNLGRGYVLRRLLRRAARYGKQLGIEGTFLHDVATTVIAENACAYPELREKESYICRMIEEEERAFAKTIAGGSAMLAEILEKNRAAGITQVAGADAFLLSDTYGFPIDLTEEIAAEQGCTVDRAGFTALVEEQRCRARADYQKKAGSSWAEGALSTDAPATKFTGYGSFSDDATILALWKNGAATDAIAEGDDAILLLDKTPFYAESGGQVGDSGTITTPASTFAVETTAKNENGHFLHVGTMTEGELRVGDKIHAEIDSDRRKKIMRNHTAGHLLQAALRRVLGEHVHQAGQLITEHRCRFDFSHFSAMTPEEIDRVSALVNEKILEAIPVTTQELPIAEARKLGAMALFGEKYGDIVRVVSAGDFSIEFCGGTHVDNTAKLGLFKIVSESSVASGVRRIEAVTGTGVLDLISSYEDTIAESAKAMKLSGVSDLAAHCATIAAENKQKEKQIAALQQQMANTQIASLLAQAKEIGGVKLVTAKLDGTVQMLRKMGDQFRSMDEALAAVLVGVDAETGKANLHCVTTAAARNAGLHAGKLAQQVAAITGGKGGGKPDAANAGIGDSSKIAGALAAAETIAAEMLKG